MAAAGKDQLSHGLRTPPVGGRAIGEDCRRRVPGAWPRMISHDSIAKAVPMQSVVRQDFKNLRNLSHLRNPIYTHCNCLYTPVRMTRRIEILELPTRKQILHTGLRSKTPSL